MKDKINGIINEFETLQYSLAEILDFLPDATFIIDKQGKIVAWNRSMEEITGLNAKDIIGKDNYEYSIPFYGERRPILIDLAITDSLEKIEKKYLTFERNNGTLISEVFVPHLKPGGAYLWAKARPLYNSKGTTIGAIETIRDITEKKIAEQKIKASKKKLKERLKELNCLYGIIKLISNPNISVDEILMRTLDLIPSACENPEAICARIVFDGKEYKTCNFSETPWKISNQIMIKEKELNIDIHSIEDKSYLKEELDLIEEINKQLKAIFEFKLFWLS